ncbi:hypothetical protein [Fluviicola taffensis]|uniref:hypothetical protein n=1 Tax=Fluviicola taffensis TaxID=191579 RepID=UPI0031380DF9
MKNLIGLITTFSILAGIWLTIYGLLISNQQNFTGISCAISGAIIFGASLIGAILLVKDSNR